MARPYRLFIVRHLKTTANEKRQYCGWTDCDLLATQRDAIEFPIEVEQVYGSDLKRTRQTAAIYFPQAVFTEDPRLRECHFGDFEEKTYEQLKDDTDYRQWLDDPWQKAPRNGETLEQVKSRVLAAVHELPNEMVVVTHSGVIRLLLDLFSRDQKPFWEWNVQNGSAWQFEWADEQQWKEGKPCTSISEVPITVKRST
ncbi:MULTISPECIES: histidine phosphatase family protein [unclassified Sporosarcina]|uniref:histidine phosphatase family protein n=1 Tax=unclassified Sporosarcina TaxID=2647733 RepID=UPI00203D506C|nr:MULTISPECIES: histidine phosphatase family protein [unclassified Sporosarcina]GKV66840.1 alpha-ribazole-5'-phosphate phosphatase [Sporosarcina sp. NCCP-2331]GLB57249.1 alpha-ribazole-5'-phosphate phosphatase [Sporosarcina sp. NCCP-2378]